jgi:hypothetical protein
MIVFPVRPRIQEPITDASGRDTFTGPSPNSHHAIHAAATTNTGIINRNNRRIMRHSPG